MCRLPHLLVPKMYSYTAAQCLPYLLMRMTMPKGVGGFILSVIVSWGKSCERDPRALFDIFHNAVYNAYVYILDGP